MSETIETLAIKAGIIPTAQQTLLLKACLLSGEPSIAAFHEWMNTLEINIETDSTTEIGLPQVYDRLDLGSQRLLSLLYKNITNQGYRHRVIQKLIGYYKYVWYKNNLLKSTLELLVDEFKSINVDFIVIKGIVQIEKYYEQYGMRPTMDIDIVVRKQDMSKAIDLLLTMGWKSKIGDPYQVVNSQTHAHTFTLNNIEIDLHYQFSVVPISLNNEKLFWSTSISQKEGYRILQPAYELYCILQHGFQWNKIPPIRWVADAKTIIKTFVESDWNMFYELLKAERFCVPVQMLNYLIKNEFVEIPRHIINLSNNKQIDTSVKKQVELALLSPEKSHFYQARRIMFRIHSQYKHNPIREIKAWMDHYRYLWNKQHYYMLIIPGIKKLLNKNQLQS